MDQHSFFVYSDPAILLNADPDSVYQNLYGNKLPYEEFSAVEKDKKIDQNYKKKPWTWTKFTYNYDELSLNSSFFFLKFFLSGSIFTTLRVDQDPSLFIQLQYQFWQKKRITICIFFENHPSKKFHISLFPIFNCGDPQSCWIQIQFASGSTTLLNCCYSENLDYEYLSVNTFQGQHQFYFRLRQFQQN